MSHALKQALLLILSFIAVFFWEASPLASLTVPLLGFLVFLYLILSNKTKKKEQHASRRFGGEMEGITIFILNTIVLLLIFSTGGLHSPLYFLLYFISFGIAFVLLPQMVFVFIVGSISIFLPDALLIGERSPDTGLIAENLIRLASLGLISPLAYFFGKEYRSRLLQQERDKQIAETISNEAANVLNNREDTLTEEDKEQLVDIIEESEKLKED